MAEARQFVLNPETGRPAVVVVSHMDIERETLQGAVEAASSALQATDDALEQARQQVAALEAQRVDQESAHEVAKSELSGYEAVAPSDGADAGADAAGGTLEDGTPVESPSEEGTPAEFPQVA